ncbi:MAG: hypothetical protein LBE36_05930 [Flavobacteriaceae bacterium]|nr:hypothetical protein [Flavobacteriaceae bacterium]
MNNLLSLCKIIPLGMNRSVEKMYSRVNRHSVGMQPYFSVRKPTACVWGWLYFSTERQCLRHFSKCTTV